MYSILRRTRLFSSGTAQLKSTKTIRLFTCSALAKMPETRKITDWVDPKDKSGEFKRGGSQFRNFVSTEKDAEFPVEAGRYHLYVSYACPWAHRALIVRKLKGLEDIIPFTSVHWHMLEKGWRFATSEDKDAPGDNVTPDPLHKDFTHLQNLYFEANKDYEGRYTVPVLWDKKQSKIVNNESAEIIRMLYSSFDSLLPKKYQDVVLLPKDLESQIDEANAWHYDTINNGVYKSGFATTQEAYERNVKALFSSLDKVEEHLSTVASKGPFYFGSQLTETDVRLFTTIIRFDPIYVQHFKTNLRDIRSGFPYLHQWVRNLYWNHEAFGPATTQFDHIKRHYSKSHSQINPHSITPLGPDKDILGLDEEVPAVAFALKKAGK